MAKRSEITTTSYILLGLLAIRPWTTYELAQQMDRTIKRFWPRARSKVYEEPKKLAALGYANASEEKVGRRSRTVYSITPEGRQVLRSWLGEPAAPPVLEWEQLAKLFFAEHSTKQDMLATLADIRAWAMDERAFHIEVGTQVLTSGSAFPDRDAKNVLFGRFFSDFSNVIDDWAEWATDVVESWPEDMREAAVDTDAIRALINRDLQRQTTSTPSALRRRDSTSAATAEE
jgi:PadR family transcriptional regulator, regulatory protein AphA